MTTRNSAAVAGWSGVDTPQPVASWYTEGLCDGIGDRLLMFDNSGTPSLELLRFQSPFAAASGFEDALRERVDALLAFDHRAFSQGRAVERLDSGDLVLVSTFTTGKRISEIFWSRRGRTGVHPAFAAWFIREATAAIADLHRQGDGIAHGALTPDRVILTPDGRLVIVEHVLGAALDRLGLAVSRLQHLGLAGVGNGSGGSPLDQRSDVIQLGWTALSLLLGRRIPPLEYPNRIDALLDEFVAAGPGGSTLVSTLRRWLERALQPTGDAFESAIDAHAGLGELRVHGGQHAIAFAANRAAVEQLAFEPPQQLPPTHATDPERAASRSTTHHDPAESSGSEVLAMAMPSEFAAPVISFEPPTNVAQLGTPADVRPARGSKAAWLVAAALTVLATAEAVWIAEIIRPTALPAAPVPIVLDTLQAGDVVIVDGRAVGVTPMKLVVTPAVRSIRLEARPIVDSVPAEPTPTAQVAAQTTATAALTQAAARERRGGLRVSAPIDLQVLEGERVLGSSSDGPVVVTAGKHDLDFVNSEVGYQARQTVDIKAGQIIPLNISPPDGRVSANAVPWAQVSIDGNPVGETPLANLVLKVGEHQITFRHPQLGERSYKIVVKANALTRVSATFTH